jgi:hypothetical protein
MVSSGAGGAVNDLDSSNGANSSGRHPVSAEPMHGIAGSALADWALRTVVLCALEPAVERTPARRRRRR